MAYAFCNLMKLFGKSEHRFNPVDRKDRYLLSDEIQNLSYEENRDLVDSENWWKANLVIVNMLFLRGFDCL